MKIGNSPEGNASPTQADRAAGKATITRKPEGSGKVAQPVKAPPTSQTPPASTQVAISSAAQAAASASVAGADDGSFDAAKVARISQAISEGKFTINASAIADKLIANAQELLDSRANKH